MTSRDFCYWLQGFIELTHIGDRNTTGTISLRQTQKIKDHLAMVFKHEIDPSFGGQNIQQALNDVHNNDVNSNIVMRC